MKIKVCSLESCEVHTLVECRRLLGSAFTSCHSEEKVPDFFHSIRHFWGGFCLTVAAAALGFSTFATKWSSPLVCIFTSNLSLLPAASQAPQKQQLREQTKIHCWLLSLPVRRLHTNLLLLVGTFCLGSLCFHWLRHGPQQSAVKVWHEESWVGVLLHEAVDDPLGVVEAHRGRRLDVPSDHVSGFVVYVDLEVDRKVVTCGQSPTPKEGRWLRVVLSAHLSHSLGLNVTFEYHLGPAGHPEGGLDLLVVLAHPPEFDVLITVLWLEESLEDLYAVWKHTVRHGAGERWKQKGGGKSQRSHFTYIWRPAVGPERVTTGTSPPHRAYKRQ